MSIERERDEAAAKAGVWVHMNRLAPTREPNPFKVLVMEARKRATRPQAGPGAAPAPSPDQRAG